jgi:hypothetical protein
MAESMLIGAGIGAGGALLSGQDPLKGAALGGAMGGATAGFGSAGVASGAGAGAGAAGSTSMMQTLATPAMTSGATAAVGNTMNPALTNGLGESSNMLTQFGRDASGYMGDMGDKIGEGFDYMNDMTGMKNRDWTEMAMGQAQNSMQPDPQQQLQAAPMGTGISRPNVDLSKSTGSLLSSNPMTSGPGGMAMTPEEMQKLKQQGLL